MRILGITLAMFLLLSAASLVKSENAFLAHWDFAEGKGRVLGDRSRNNVHGKIHGAKWVKCGKGYALEFDGVDDYVDCGSGKSLGLGKEITFSAWIQPRENPPKEAVIVGEVPFRWTATLYKGRVWFYIKSGRNICAGAVPFHQWSHIAPAGLMGGARVVYSQRGAAARRKRPSPRDAEAQRIAAG